VTTSSSAAAFVSATIGGSYNGGFDASAQLEVWPAGTALALQSVVVEPANVMGPNPATGQ